MLGNLKIMCRYAWNNGITSIIDVTDNSSYILNETVLSETMIRSSNFKGEDEEHYLDCQIQLGVGLNTR
jgi:hypothetical protein